MRRNSRLFFLQEACFVALITVLAAVFSTRAATITWTNAVGGNWSTATDWNPNQVPGATDNAYITNNGTYTVTVNATATVGTLTLGGTSGTQTLDLSSGIFTNNGASTGNANGTMEINGGTLIGSGSLVLGGPLNWSGGTIKSAVQCNGGAFSGDDFLDGGQIINLGALAWNAPTILDGAGSVISNAAAATITITGSSSFTENEYGPPQTFYNAGQLNVSASGSSAAIINDIFLNSGTTTISAGTMAFSGGGTNTGTISVTAGTAALQLSGGTFDVNSGSTVSDSGNLILSSGTVNLAGTVTVSGTNIFSGATVNVTGNYPMSSPLVFSGGSAALDGSATLSPSVMTMTAGTLTNSIPVAVSGPFDWSGGTLKGVVKFNGGAFSGDDFLDGGQIINLGALAWNTPTILDGAGSVISNAAAATITIIGSGSFTENEYGPPQTFYNAGQLNVSASASSVAIISDIFLNSGTTTISAGTMAFSGGGTNTGTISVTAGTAALQLSGGTFDADSGSTVSDTGNLILSSGTVNLAGTVTVSGTNIFSGATVNVTGSYPITSPLLVSGGTAALDGGSALTPPVMTMTAGTLTNSIPVAVSGPFNWSGGTLKGVVKFNGGTFSNDDFLDGGQIINLGALTWNSPTILDGAGSVISNASGATITITGSGGFTENEYGPPQTFDNAGQVNVSLTGPGSIADAFVNSGGLTNSAGSMTFSGAGTNTGTITINGGILDFNGAHSLAGGTLNFGLNALNNYGSNVLSGAAALAGTLSATFNGSYLPSVGNTYNLMTYGSSSGSFTRTNLSPLAVWQVNQGATALNIVVLKLVPQVTWAAPAAIVYGTALSSTQLDAAATWNGSAVPGAFTYNPPLTTVLSSGSNQTLSVTFTPTDTTTYTNVTTNVLMTVQLAPLTVTANNLVKNYGQTVNFAGTEFATSGLVNGDTVTGASLSSAGALPTASVSGSPYVISITNAVGDAGLTNYTITYDTGALTVNTAPLTITANNRNKNYGQTVTFVGTEFTSSALPNGETVGTVTLTSAGAAPTAMVIGSPYNIVPSAATGGTFNPVNYSITYDDGALTVNTAPLTITADNTNKIIGQTITFAGTEFTASGLQNSETIGLVTLNSTGTAATAAAGPYNIVPSSPTGGTFNQLNYADTFVNGTLTVEAKPLLTISLGTTNNIVTFPTLPGETYQLQAATNLLTASWTSVGGAINGTGGSASMTNTIASRAIYYRLQINN